MQKYHHLSMRIDRFYKSYRVTIQLLSCFIIIKLKLFYEKREDEGLRLENPLTDRK